MTLTSKFDLGQEVWFMVENKAVKGVVSRLELGNMWGFDNGDHEAINEYRESYYAHYDFPTARSFTQDLGANKYFNHGDIGVSVFTSKEELLKSL